MAQRKISGTNMVERTPRTKKAAAGLTAGALGAALAATIITGIENVAAAQDAWDRADKSEKVSRKDRLAELVKLSQADWVAFHGAMLKRVEAVKAAMELVKASDPNVKGLREYFEQHKGDQTIYVQASMWQKIARCLDGGWKPDLSKSWADIDTDATAYKNKLETDKGQPAGENGEPTTQPVASRKRKQGRQKVEPVQKAVNAVKRAMVSDDNKPLPKNNRNLAGVVDGIIADATVEELQEVAACVQRRLDAAIATREAMAKAKDKANKGEKPTVPTGNAGESGTTHTGASVKVSKAGKRTGAPTPTATEQKETAAAPQARRVAATPSGRPLAKS